MAEILTAAYLRGAVSTPARDGTAFDQYRTNF